eukprot:2228414-Rhodomonas_salina.1
MAAANVQVNSRKLHAASLITCRNSRFVPCQNVLDRPSGQQKFKKEGQDSRGRLEVLAILACCTPPPSLLHKLESSKSRYVVTTSENFCRALYGSGMCTS